mgnify:CR=1 FL=1
MKILFIGPTRIGDTILSTSIINFYLQKYDNCSFSIITSPFARDIYTNMPRLSKILVINKMGAIEKAAIENLQTIISGASAYCPTNFALVHDKPHDNIASIIRVFRVKSLRDNI